MVTHNAVQSQPSPYSDSLPVPVDIRRVAEFVEFAKWFARPSDERDPKTQKKLAEHIRLDEDTLSAWKKRPEFLLLAGEFMREWMRDRTPDVMAHLYNRIASGDGGAADVKLFLALAEGAPANPKPRTN